MKYRFIGAALSGLLAVVPPVFADEALKKNPEKKEGTSEASQKNFVDRVGKYVGINYDSFFNGPGIGAGVDTAPGNLSNTIGLNSFNLVSVRGKINDRIGIDVQLRSQIVWTQTPEFRWQGQRFGISGLLLKGETWSLRGVLNTDLPIPGLVGQLNQERTLLFNPGTFAFFSWKPKFTKANLFVGLFPRVFFYRDNAAMASQDGNRPAGAKPQVSLQFLNSVNIPLNSWIDARVGAWIQFQKNAIGDFQRWVWPLEIGVNFKVNKYLSIYPFVNGTGPWDNGIRRGLGLNSPWTHTIATGVWLRGTLL